jgi:hypothetical protein
LQLLTSQYFVTTSENEAEGCLKEDRRVVSTKSKAGT